ncbi:MAG: DUF3784 domain-containing protein [Oscillibacter sp.]|nr:DUF3784 domain-containing protein [Oscillibacter sp.]
MNPVMMLLLSAACVGIGIAFWNEKWGVLLPSLKKMDPEKKDIRKVYRANAVEMFALAVCCLVVWAGALARSRFIINAGVILTLAVVAVSLVYENTGNRFDRK